jgi:hypothetical protein
MRVAAWTGPSSARSSSPPSANDHDHAGLAVLLGLNGLRVSEACAADIEDLGIDHGRCALSVWETNRP